MVWLEVTWLGGTGRTIQKQFIIIVAGKTSGVIGFSKRIGEVSYCKLPATAQRKTTRLKILKRLLADLHYFTK